MADTSEIYTVLLKRRQEKLPPLFPSHDKIHFPSSAQSRLWQIFQVLTVASTKNVVRSPWSRSTFRRCVLPPSSGRWWKAYAPLTRSTSTRLHGAVSLQAVFFKVVAVQICLQNTSELQQHAYRVTQGKVSARQRQGNSLIFPRASVNYHGIDPRCAAPPPQHPQRHRFEA
jgi:hypothetical protein